jgi:hypothetical protein
MVVCAVVYEPVSTGNSLLTGKLTGNLAISAILEVIFQPKAVVPQRFLTEFPTKINRETFVNIRDRNPTNRVFSASYQGSEVSVHFSHTFPVAR